MSRDAADIRARIKQIIGNVAGLEPNRIGDEAKLRDELAQSGLSNVEFDIAWARQVLARAIDQMRAECVRSDRADLWGVFECRILGPLLDGTEPLEYQALVERFGLASPAQASNVLMTGKRMFARSLRSVVAEYERDESEIDAEIADLRKILSRAGAGN